MNRVSNDKWKPNHPIVIGAVALVALLLGTIFVANIDRLDLWLAKGLSQLGVGAGFDHLAVYDSFLLYGSANEFFKFSSGNGQYPIASFRVQLPNGEIYNIAEFSEEAVKELTADLFTLPAPTGSATVRRYVYGFDNFSFVDSQLWGITISKGSDIKIDFGDGEFVSLPVERERVLRLLGEPREWTRSARGMP